MTYRTIYLMKFIEIRDPNCFPHNFFIDKATIKKNNDLKEINYNGNSIK